MTSTDALPLRLEDIAEGMSETVGFVVSQDDMLHFAELSGDRNPLHLDETFARAKGFKGQVVYGALMVAKVSQLIGMRLPGRNAVWAGLRLDFIKPLHVGEEASVEGVVSAVSNATGMIELKLRVRSALGQTLAKGSAEVLYVP